MIYYEIIKSYLMLLKVKCDNIGIMGICVINIVPSQQEDPEFDSTTWWGAFCVGFTCSLRVCMVSFRLPPHNPKTSS